MLIKVTFESMEELKDFAREVLSGEGQAVLGQTEKTVKTVTDALVQPTPTVQNTAPVQPVPTQQLAPVNTGQTQPAAVTPPPLQTTVPTTQPSYTMEDLSKAGMTLMDSGRQGELRNLLAQFGVQSLPDLPKEQYGAFATALRGLGAQI